MDPLKQIRLVKHGTVCLSDGETTIYVDPYQLDHTARDADLIVITHSHSDHFSPEDIEKICQPDTCFAAPPDVAEMLERQLHIPDEYISRLTCQSPSLCYEFGAAITPVEAENKNHPLHTGFGVVIEMTDVRYYISGDTDRLAQDADCDVLFVVCDGIYNMPNYLEQVPSQVQAMDERPGLIVPYHYGSFPGTAQNGKKLAQVLRQQGYNVKLLIK